MQRSRPTIPTMGAAVFATLLVLLLVVFVVGSHRTLAGNVDDSVPVEHGGQGYLFGRS